MMILAGLSLRVVAAGLVAVAAAAPIAIKFVLKPYQLTRLLTFMDPEADKSGAGYHLFKLEDVEGLNPEMLADARQQAREILLQRKAQERLDEWLDELRRRALIAVRL